MVEKRNLGTSQGWYAWSCRREDTHSLSRFNHRAGSSACGGCKRGQSSQALGRSRGGFSTKIHIASTAKQELLRFTLTGGQVADINEADQLLASIQTQSVVADRAYDCDRLIHSICEGGAQAVVPPKRNRKVQRYFNKEMYRVRNTVERLIGRLKQFRRIATRYDKTATSFGSFINFVMLFIF